MVVKIKPEFGVCSECRTQYRNTHFVTFGSFDNTDGERRVHLIRNGKCDECEYEDWLKRTYPNRFCGLKGCTNSIMQAGVGFCPERAVTLKDVPTPDNVNHPSHYTTGKIEVIDFIEDKQFDYHLGNAIKYISRAGKKDKSKEIEDLCKAIWYINRRIKTLKENA